ncbi:hypothetical protein [Streptomyces canus]|uniref:hypothetical protein n=1 Tax=Streptomyces canus TaxID=58343 RepID=UPI001319F124|nr:hypothetical protein [Streptomyces canus]
MSPGFLWLSPILPPDSDFKQLAALSTTTVVDQEMHRVIVALVAETLGEAVREAVGEAIGKNTYPEESTETALADIYAELFDLATFNATTGVYDLDGISLDVLRLARTARTARTGLGQEPPALNVLRAPSMHEPARLIAAPYNTARSDAPVAPPQAMAKPFTHERPFHALRARGLSPAGKPFGNFTQTTRSDVAAIPHVEPHGRYVLAGCAFAATVVFEIATGLEANGEWVASTGAFNSPSLLKDRMDEPGFIDKEVNPAWPPTDRRAEALAYQGIRLHAEAAGWSER